MPDALQLVPVILADLWSGLDKSADMTLVLHFDACFTDFDTLSVLAHDLSRYLKRGLSAVEVRKARSGLDEQERLAVIKALGPVHEHGALRF